VTNKSQANQVIARFDTKKAIADFSIDKMLTLASAVFEVQMAHFHRLPDAKPRNQFFVKSTITICGNRQQLISVETGAEQPFPPQHDESIHHLS
jgi:hypothetical protein